MMGRRRKRQKIRQAMNRRYTFRVPLNWQALPNFRSFPTTKKLFVITAAQYGNPEYPSDCKGRLRHAGWKWKLSKAYASTGPDSGTHRQSPHFNKHPYFSQIRKEKEKKKTKQISRNSIQFPYIYLSELAAQGIEMKQEASDNIISLFFNLFLLQHKHRLL